MIWLLDTNALIDALNGSEPGRARLNAVKPADSVTTSILVEAELRFGTECSGRRAANIERVERQLGLLDEVLPRVQPRARASGTG